ncbi:MAG: glycosyltransferase family A protein [Acidobacteriota bacterium]|nr:glycosyltransferase family A protein [Acidobacteriota bacterium]
MTYFSVIIPTYNRANFIKTTVKSVLNQSFQDFEVIVVDDGSTDGTSEIVKTIKDNRVRYFYKENEERAVARNYGAKLAKGKYVSFLDSDDIVYKNYLEKALEMIEKYHQPEWFHLGYEISDLKRGITTEGPCLPEIANFSLIKGNLLSCNNVFIRKDIALRHPFNETRELSGTEDYELWLRLASRYPLYCSNEIVSTIMHHENRSVVTTNKEKLLKRAEILEKSLGEDFEFIQKFGRYFCRIKAYNRAYIALHLALSQHSKLEVSKYLVRAVLCSPTILRRRIFYGAIKRSFISI